MWRMEPGVKQALFDENQRHVVIVGAGFIGLGLVRGMQALRQRGNGSGLADHVLPAFDPEVSEALEAELAETG